MIDISASAENLRYPHAQLGPVKRRAQRRGPHPAQPTTAALCLGIACLIGGACLGCGGDSESPETVPPPAVDQQDVPGGTQDEAPSQPAPPEPDTTDSGATEAQPQPPAGSADRQAPNSFALPPGEIPSSTSGTSDSSPSSGGLQMPERGGSPPEPSASESPENRPDSSGNPNAPSGGSAASGAELDLQYASWQAVHQAATGGGKITVVDLWALSCQPCLKEFPGLVRLNEQFGESTRCIGFNVDFDGRKTRPPESYEERIVEFLGAVDADFPNYISNTPSLDVFADVGIDSIPAVLVFDQQGELVQRFADTGDTTGFTYEQDIIPLVAKLAG